MMMLSTNQRCKIECNSQQDFSQFGGRFTGKSNQREVLFDSGCEFRFDKWEIEDGRYVFYLTEI